jgi:hypothetical protein
MAVVILLATLMSMGSQVVFAADASTEAGTRAVQEAGAG